MISLCTKFEISTFTHYKDMKGDENCKNLGGFGDLQINQGHHQHNHSIEHMGLSITL